MICWLWRVVYCAGLCLAFTSRSATKVNDEVAMQVTATQPQAKRHQTERGRDHEKTDDIPQHLRLRRLSLLDRGGGQDDDTRPDKYLETLAPCNLESLYSAYKLKLAAADLQGMKQAEN